MSWWRPVHAATPRLEQDAFDLLCLTIAVVLGVHAGHMPWWLDFTLALVLGLRWWQRRRHGGRAPLFLKLPLMTLLLLAVIAVYGSLFGREPGSAFAVGLLVLKVLEAETPRDARVGVSFGCFGLMAALLFNQGLLATLFVALGLLPALATLRALEPTQSRTTLSRQLLPGLRLLLATLPLALLAFLLVPRLSSPLWGAPNAAAEARTGLSEEMSPGNFTELLTDDHPAMRVAFDGSPPPPGQRYFRAFVMNQYDGRSWTYHPADSTQAGAPVSDADALVRYRVDLEPTDQTVLPALDVPLQIPAGARFGADREVVRGKPAHDALSYAITSALHYRLQPELDAAGRRRALRLPRGFNPRTLALGRQWRERFGSDDGAIAQAALRLFHDGGFRYTLAPTALGRDAVDDFLFDTHEGFCEHYASSFTVLMRAAGVPARVVTGYQGGYWNRLGSYLLVRRSDAHAWGEVWLAGRGWVRVDPTAAVRPERISQGAAAAADGQLGWSHDSWLQGLGNQWDVVNRWWNQGVIGFDSLRQRGLLTPFGIRETSTTTLAVLLAISSLVFGALGLGWALMRRTRMDPVLAALRELEGKLARAGVRRGHSEGPQHYLRRAARALPGRRRELAHLMQSYLELRYACDEPTPELTNAFQRAVRDFRPGRVVQ